MLKILIAEDEPAMQKIIKVYLEREGYKVDVADNGQDALEKLYEERYDLLILDWMMPGLNGIEVCREVNRLQLDLKILMLTAKSEIEDEVSGLSEGVHEYIRKPFDPRVLILRIKKLLNEGEALGHKELKFYPDKGYVAIDDEKIKLSKIEQRLLLYFMQNKGIILSREKILNHVWGMEYEGDDRTIDTHIRRLRKKIGEEYIQTYRGVGYSMRENNE
ncbi:MAG: response regulator transcription factor [Cellulosilyticaceae bacterium]